MLRVFRLNSTTVLRNTVCNVHTCTTAVVGAGRRCSSPVVPRLAALPRVTLSSTARFYSNSTDATQLAIDELGEKFSEARELLEDARESYGSTYFSEDYEVSSV